MSGALVLDSSALVALLVDASGAGDWVAATISGATIAAPELAPYETANILRRHQLAGMISPLEATLAHADLLELPLQLWPYAAVADRAWALRDNLTGYDASYVALAELLGGSVVTLDARLRRAPGPACPIMSPPDGISLS